MVLLRSTRPLPAAVGTGFAHDLSRAAAVRAGARNGEKSLLVMDLSAAAASRAGDHSRAGFRAGAVAAFAEFQAREANFGIHSGGGFFKAEFHVVAKVRAALRAVARAAAAENILEAEEIAEDILKFVEDGLIDAAVEAAARKSRIAKAVIRGALLRVGKNRVGFGGFAEFFLRFLFF